MNNLKKVGLTALGTALVATSAQAADVSVSMGTSIGFVGQDNNNQGSGWTMTDSVTFTTSGEMDNGMSISHTLEVDGTAVDTHTIAITMDGMGTLTYVGDGSTGPIGAWDDVTPTANEEAHGTTFAGTKFGAANNDPNTQNSFVYDYTIMDGLALKASYIPSDGTTSVDSSLDYGVLYTGIDGLSIYAAMGENNAEANSADLSMFAAVYSAGAFTVGYQMNETDYGSGTDDEDFTAIGISYAVSDDLSVSINSSTVDEEGSDEDQDATAINFSYTSGGMTITGTHAQMDNVGGTATSDNTGYELGVSFAF